jgi:alkyl sulfatase BDS1-like metallo-beta-lactamase superfamily hydrolase
MGTSRATLDAIALQRTTFPAAVRAGQIKVAGRVAALAELLGLPGPFSNLFPLVEPRPPR